MHLLPQLGRRLCEFAPQRAVSLAVYSSSAPLTESTLLPDGNVKPKIGDTVVAGFRPQIYRAPGSAKVAAVSGIQRKKPRLLGPFDRSGLLLEKKTESPCGLDTSVVRKLMDTL